MSYSARIQEAMQSAGISKTGLARGVGVSYQAVKKVVDGKTGFFSAMNNQRAASLLGVSAEWLATGEGDRSADAQRLLPLDGQEISLVRLLRALPAETRAAVVVAAHEVAERHAAHISALLSGSEET